MSEKHSDPNLYFELSKPYESNKECDDALSEFYRELGELRKKHKVRDLLVVTYGSVKDADGTISEFMNHSSYGNSLNQLPMSAFAFGRIQKDSETVVAKLLSGK